VHEKRAKLLGRMRRTVRAGENNPLDTPTNHGQNGTDTEGDMRRALDWRVVQARLSPVMHRWDLAILCHLDGSAARRPGDLLAAINSEAADGRQLSAQFLSVRLRALENSGYIRHEDESLLPHLRVYYLQQIGQALISDLLKIIGPAQPTSMGA